MFSDPVSFSGDTRVEVITVLANCGMDTDRARRALVTWIRHKQDKGRSTEHILAKLRDIESKFIKDTSLHGAFRDARAETFLPRAPDLPLPPYLAGKRRSSEQTPEFVPFIITPSSTGRSSIASSSELLASFTQHTSSPTFPLRLSRGSSQMSDTFPERSNASQRTSHLQSITRASGSRAPRIQIPRSLQPGPNSPITSSPDESEIHFRYRYLSHPVGPSSQYNGLHTPVSASPPEPPEFPLSPITSRDQVRGRSSYGFSPPPPPSTRISIPRALSQRSVPISPPTSSSDESDPHPRRYRPISQPAVSASPGFRRVTPPRTIPPDVPLPPIPSDDQSGDSDDDSSKRSQYAEEPSTPLRSLGLCPSSSVRPLPIQPIPSPVPGPNESDTIDLIDEDSLRQNWDGSTGDLSSDIVVRQDSPVYMFHHGRASSAGISPPPPYIDQAGTYFPSDMSTISDSLDRAVKEYGGFPGVRSVVIKCIEFHSGYEPPYWQTQLQACGLRADAAERLVAEMCKQVDWTAMFRKSF